MKGVYLCSRAHRLPGYDIDYNDVEFYPGINLLCDCMDVDLNGYDFVIATPPCNYYSRANWRRVYSDVAQSTKHLLPGILEKCQKFGKPFIIENVLNSSLLPKSEVYEFDFGQHHFYTNLFMFVPDKSFAIRQNKQNVSRSKRDGNYNVDFIIKLFLEVLFNV